MAEQLINPFGEDDDDFNMNWIIDRNLQISLLSVDDLHGQRPALVKDIFWGELPPDNLPYTKSTIKTMKDPYLGSTADLRSGLVLVAFYQTNIRDVTVKIKCEKSIL